MQNTMNAIATLNSTSLSVSISVPAAAGAAMTRTFFTHCLGRSALIIPSRRFFGGCPFTSASSAAPSRSFAVCGSAQA